MTHCWSLRPWPRRRRLRFRRLARRKPGSRSTALQDDHHEHGTKIDVVSLIWRYKNVYSALLTGGISGSFDPAAVVALGRKQQARILTAAG